MRATLIACLRGLHVRRSFALAVCCLGAFARRAESQCAVNAIDHTQLNAAGGAATASISDTGWNPKGKSFSYTAQDKTLYVVDNTNLATKYSVTPSTATISNVPIPVPLKNNGSKTSVFIAGADAKVRRYDFDSNAPGTPSLMCTSPLLGRGATCSSDTIVGSPTVQLYAYSAPGGAFQTTWGDDLVFIVTKHMCSDTTGNKVYALRGSDCTVAWTFNLANTYPMSYGSEGCAIDYTNNLLYCGTQVPISHPQASLWAISTVTGTLSWSVNADSLITRPELRGNRLYLGTQTGTLRVHSAVDGSTIWTTPISGGGSINRSPWPEPRLTGGMNTVVLVGDSTGVLHSVTDNGNAPGLSWTYTPTGGAKVMSAPIVSNIAGKAYVGLNNGQLHQLNLITGTDEQYTAAAGATDTVYDPSLDIATTLSTDLDRMRVATSINTAGTGGQNFKTYCVPWPLGGGAGTSSLPPGGGPEPQPHVSCSCPANTPCVTYVCNTTTGNCDPQVAANNTSCNDGISCGCDSPSGGVCPGGADGHCQSGQCVFNTTDSTCVPNVNTLAGQRGSCPNGTYACGGTKCADIMNDNANCGGCGHNCAATRFGIHTPSGVDKCVQGICVRDETFYCSPAPPTELQLNNLSTSLTGADDIAFPTLQTLSPGGARCGLAFSTYNTTGTGTCSGTCGSFSVVGPGFNNGVALVDPNNLGQVTKWSEPSCGCLFAPPVYPFHGVWPMWVTEQSATYDSNWAIAGTRINYPAGGNPQPGMFLVVPGDFTSRIKNANFENGLTNWTSSSAPGSTGVATSGCNGGAECAQINSITTGGCGTTNNNYIYQGNITIPDGASTLDFAYKVVSNDSLTYDNFHVVFNYGFFPFFGSKTVLANTLGNGAWQYASVDMTDLAGVNGTLEFMVKDDGCPGDPTTAYVDDITLSGSDKRIDDSNSTSDVFGSTSCSGPNCPYNNGIYNQGVVGPVMIESGVQEGTSWMGMLYANWPNNGDLFRINADCSAAGSACSFTNPAVIGWPPPAGSGWVTGGRISTLTWTDYACRQSTSCTTINAIPQYAVITQGTKVFFWHWQGDGPTGGGSSGLWGDMADPNWYQPDPNNVNEHNIIGVLSSSADPLYGDLYFETRDVSGQVEDLVLYFSNSYTAPGGPIHFYNVGDMAKSLSLKGSQNGAPISVPFSYSGDGRIAAANADLIRMTVSGPNTNPTFISMPLWP